MSRVKLFLDTEFTGLHQNTTLISIGIISEFGDTFYAEFNDYNANQIANDHWIEANVINNLLHDTKEFNSIADRNIYGNKSEIAYALKNWLEQFRDVEFWSDCLAYDWVLFNDLFKQCNGLPRNVSYIPFDICTLMKMKNVDPDIYREDFIDEIIIGEKHNSLYDARVIKACYTKLMNM